MKDYWETIIVTCNFQYQLIKRKRYVFKDHIFEK